MKPSEPHLNEPHDLTVFFEISGTVHKVKFLCFVRPFVNSFAQLQVMHVKHSKGFLSLTLSWATFVRL